MAPRSTKTLGDVLREARIHNEIGLRELARRIEKSPSYLSDIEADRRVPSEEVLGDLARILGLDFGDLMALARRLGENTERLMDRDAHTVALFRKISKLSADQRRRLAEQVAEMSETKDRKK